MSNLPVYNIFQEGLRSGSHIFRRTPNKQYAYVEHPTEGWRVYLRSCAFLHDTSKPNHTKFAVVKATHKKLSSYAWEPPKGQMEGKDLVKSNSITPTALLKSLQNNALREIQEESKIVGPIDLHYSGMVFQNREKEYPEGHVFQYVIFVGSITPEQYNDAKERFRYYKEDAPKEFKALPKDQQEKDDIAWFDPSETALFGRWSPSIVMMYINSFLSSNLNMIGGNKRGRSKTKTHRSKNKSINRNKSRRNKIY
jgi:hypothetical protein